MSYGYEYDTPWCWASSNPPQPIAELSQNESWMPNYDYHHKGPFLDHHGRVLHPDGAPLPKYPRTTNHYQQHPSSQNRVPPFSVQDFAQENRRLIRENEKMKRKMQDYETTVRVLMENNRELEALKRNKVTKETQTKEAFVPLEKYRKLKLKCHDLERKNAQLTLKINGLKTPKSQARLLTAEIHRLNAVVVLKEKESGELLAVVGQLKQTNSQLSQELFGGRLQTSHLEIKLSTLQAKLEALDTAAKKEKSANSTICLLTEEKTKLSDKFEKLKQEKELLEEGNRILADKNTVLTEESALNVKPRLDIKHEIIWGSDLEKTIFEMQEFVLQRDEQLMQLQQNNALITQELHMLQEQTRDKEQFWKNTQKR